MEQPSSEPSAQSSSEPKPTEQPQTPSSSSSSAYTNPTTAATGTSAPPSTTQPLPIQSATSSSPSPNSASLTPQSTQQFTPSQARPPFNRPWQQPQPSNFSHYPPIQAQSSTNSTSPALSVPSAPRGGITIGVPAQHPGVATQSGTFSSMNAPPYGPSSGGMGRNVSESVLPSSSSQVGQPIGVGMIGGSFASSSAMRPPGLPPHQLRPVQSSGRPQSPSTPSFQGHGMIRVPSVGSPGSPSPNSQSLVPQNQPWLSSGTQGKPPLPPTPLRPQLSSQSVHQRPHLSHPHHHSMPISPQQQQLSSIQQSQHPQQPQQPQQTQQPQQPQQPPTSVPQEQYPQSRIQQSSPASQQQIGRGQGTGILRPQSAIPSGAIQPGVLNRPTAAEAEETCDRILSKRSIQELVAQVDPLEKLDPEVEDILVDIADDFIESITTFGCSLAKHRKSTTLEAKDILLHLERNWHMTIPGFGGDEIRTYKKPLTTDIHRERLAVIKRSILNADVTHLNPKGSAAQTSGNAKGHPAKGPSFVGSPALKLREPA